MSQDTPDNVTTLHAVAAPKAEDRVKADVVQLLERVLALAQQGEVECVFIVCSHADGTYSEAVSQTLHFSQMIGQVEIVKQNWITRYLASLLQRGKT